MSLTLIGSEGAGKITETAGTRIRRLIGGKGGCFTHLLNMRYTAGATAHTITVMRGQSYTTLSAAALAAQADVVLTAAITDGTNAVAANDLVAIKKPDGSWHLGLVSAWTAGTLTLTLTANVPTGGFNKGAAVICYGVAGDSGHDNYKFAAGSGATTNYPAVENGGSLIRSRRQNEPLIIDSDNATNAGTLENATVGHAVDG